MSLFRWRASGIVTIDIVCPKCLMFIKRPIMAGGLDIPQVVKCDCGAEFQIELKVELKENK